MRISLFISAFVGILIGSNMFLGQGLAETDDTLERLPIPNTQQGLDRPGRDGESGERRPPPRKKRLVSGGGLLLSFDANADRIVTFAEVDAGISAAFVQADANQNTYITALEQASWVETLEFPDASLTNPVRFDPNLDSRVTVKEFTRVVGQLYRQYEDGDLGHVSVDDLYEVPKRGDRSSRPPPPKQGGERGERGGDRGGGQGPRVAN